MWLAGLENASRIHNVGTAGQWEHVASLDVSKRAMKLSNFHGGSSSARRARYEKAGRMKMIQIACGFVEEFHAGVARSRAPELCACVLCMSARLMHVPEHQPTLM